MSRTRAGFRIAFFCTSTMFSSIPISFSTFFIFFGSVPRDLRKTIGTTITFVSTGILVSGGGNGVWTPHAKYPRGLAKHVGTLFKKVTYLHLREFEGYHQKVFGAALLDSLSHTGFLDMPLFPVQLQDSNICQSSIYF